MYRLPVTCAASGDPPLLLTFETDTHLRQRVIANFHGLLMIVNRDELIAAAGHAAGERLEGLAALANTARRVAARRAG